jgi:hypothetical protein
LHELRSEAADAYAQPEPPERAPETSQGYKKISHNDP